MKMTKAHSFNEAVFLIRENRSFIVIGTAPVIFRANYDKKSYLVIKEHLDGVYRAMECPRTDIKRVMKVAISSSPDFLDDVGVWRELTEKEVDYAKHEIQNHVEEDEEHDAEDGEHDDGTDDTASVGDAPIGTAAAETPKIIEEESGEAVYILTNPSLPNQIKIGRTHRSAEDRAIELSGTTGIPTPFVVFRAFHVSNSLELEKIVHERLKSYRVSSNREFFTIDPETACDVISSIVESTKKPSEDDIDGMLLFQAQRLCQTESSVWPGLIMSRLSITYEKANRIMAYLVESQILSPNGTPLRPFDQSRKHF